MPTLLDDGFSHRVFYILNDYVSTPTKLQEFLQNRFKRMLAYIFYSKQIIAELALNEAKHEIAGNFSVLYLPEIGPSTILQRARQYRKTPTLNALDLEPAYFAVEPGQEEWLVTYLDARLLDTQETRRRNLDVLAKELSARLAMLDETRAGHKIGQLEGIFGANLAALNLMINFYNKIAIHLVEDFDAIDQNSDYYLRLFRFTAEYLRDFAYDRSLSRYSEQHKIKIAPEHYLGSGAEKLPPMVQDFKLRVLYNSLVYSSLAYSQTRILRLIKQDPTVILSHQYARILRYLFTGITDGTDITNMIPRALQELHMNITAFDMLIRREIASVPDKNSNNIARLGRLADEYPCGLQPANVYVDVENTVTEEAVTECEVDPYAATSASPNDEIEPCDPLVIDPNHEALPPVFLHADPEKRQMDYALNVSECGSEGPEEIARAQSAFTPQLTPLWRNVYKAGENIFTPQCGLYPKHKLNGKVSPAPTLPATRLVVS